MSVISCKAPLWLQFLIHCSVRGCLYNICSKTTKLKLKNERTTLKYTLLIQSASNEPKLVIRKRFLLHNYRFQMRCPGARFLRDCSCGDGYYGHTCSIKCKFKKQLLETLNVLFKTFRYCLGKSKNRQEFGIVKIIFSPAVFSRIHLCDLDLTQCTSK